MLTHTGFTAQRATENSHCLALSRGLQQGVKAQLAVVKQLRTLVTRVRQARARLNVCTQVHLHGQHVCVVRVFSDRSSQSTSAALIQRGLRSVRSSQTQTCHFTNVSVSNQCENTLQRDLELEFL